VEKEHSPKEESVLHFPKKPDWGGKKIVKADQLVSEFKRFSTNREIERKGTLQV